MNEYFKNSFVERVTDSTKKSLHSRLTRHLKRTKNKFWHIDYVLSDPYPSVIVDIMINEKPCECVISHKLHSSKNCELVKKGFGSSDCNCISHFFRIKEDKIENLTSMLSKDGFSSIRDYQ
jgi:Uri superfamily endonuclease